MLFRLVVTACLLLVSPSAWASPTADQIQAFLKEITHYPEVAWAVVQVESNGNYKTIGDKTLPGKPSYGLMQVKLGTAQMMGFRGSVDDLMDWRVNLLFGVKYLEFNIARYGSVEAALAAYNAGKARRCPKTSKRCRPGEWVNQGYVDKVLWKINTIPGSFSGV